MKRLLRWLGFGDRATTVSRQWLADQDRLGDRIEFHAPAIDWPIKKRANELGWWNRTKLRKSA